MGLSKFTQHHALFDFPEWGKWANVIELLIASNLLAVMMFLSSLTALQQFSWINLAQHLLFVSWIAIGFCCSVSYLPISLHKLAPVLLVLLCFMIIIVLIIISHSLLAALSYFLQKPGSTFSAYIFSGLTLAVLQGICVGVLCLRYIYIRDQWMRRRQSELVAKIQALQSRIQPHFLFNSLNSVISLISIDPVKAEKMLLDLSSLFRASLAALKEVSLAEEIALCQRYLDIERMRLGERLQVTWKIDSDQDLSTVKIPLLTLQPLLENSIYHGVETTTQVSEVKILVEVVERKVNIVLSNPYLEKGAASKGHGIAIENVKQRLIAHYGLSVNLSTHARHGYFTVLLSYKL